MRRLSLSRIRSWWGEIRSLLFPVKAYYWGRCYLWY